MSAPGPSSIPTSADPRTRRPTKKRALSPTSSHAATLTALFAKPDQHIPVPPPAGATARPRHHLPPEIVSNVQGSSAGAGSGEFHVYKASRRREYERLRQMDEDLRQSQEQDAFERAREERRRGDEERTRKRRGRRGRMRARKERRKGGEAAEGREDEDGDGSGRGGGGGGQSGGGDGIGNARGEESGGGTGDAPWGGGREEGGASAVPVPAVGLVIHDDD